MGQTMGPNPLGANWAGNAPAMPEPQTAQDHVSVISMVEKGQLHIGVLVDGLEVQHLALPLHTLLEYRQLLQAATIIRTPTPLR